MIKLKNNILLIIISTCTIMFGDTCTERLDLECIEISHYIKSFITGPIRSQQKPTDNYPDYKSSLECYVWELLKSNCAPSTQDSILINLQYYYGIYSAFIQGDLEFYDNILSNSKALINNEISYIKEQRQNTLDQDELIILDKKTIHYNDLYMAISDSLKSLNDNYADMKLTLDSDLKYTEMTQVIDKGVNKPVIIEIKAPPDSYSVPEYLQRLNYLQKFPIKFELTSYDSSGGYFFCKIPFLPIKLGKSASKIKPKDTYTLSFSGGKRYRFEFFKDWDGTLSKVPPIKVSKNWVVQETVPSDWTKMKIPKTLSWEYCIKNNDMEIAEYQHIPDRFYRYVMGNDIIFINNNDHYVVYQRLFQNQEKINYDLKIFSEEKNKWVRTFVPMTVLITSIILYAGTF